MRTVVRPHEAPAQHKARKGGGSTGQGLRTIPTADHVSSTAGTLSSRADLIFDLETVSRNAAAMKPRGSAGVGKRFVSDII